MRDFNSYQSNQKSGNNTSDNLKTKLNDNAFNMLNAFANKYEGKSEQDLISAIILEAEKGRKNGTLTDQDIDNFAKTISPMLTPSQRVKLNAVVSKIKKG